MRVGDNTVGTSTNCSLRLRKRRTRWTRRARDLGHFDNLLGDQQVQAAKELQRVMSRSHEGVCPATRTLTPNSGGRTPGSQTPGVPATPSSTRWRWSTLAVCLCTRLPKKAPRAHHSHDELDNPMTWPTRARQQPCPGNKILEPTRPLRRVRTAPHAATPQTTFAE